MITQREFMKMSQGVPPGSVLGPLLWNILYDGMLNTDLGEGTRTVAYADDLALFIEDLEALKYVVNDSLRRIHRH